MDAVQSMGLNQLAGWLKEQGERLAGLSFEKPLRAVAFYLANQAKKCFDQGRDPGGSPWLPLVSPSARRGGASAKPLRDTGILMASLSGQGGGNVTLVSDNALTWGTSVAYAGFHQYGTKNIPARPFLGVTPEMDERMALILMDYVDQMLKGQA